VIINYSDTPHGSPSGVFLFEICNFLWYFISMEKETILTPPLSDVPTEPKAEEHKEKAGFDVRIVDFKLVHNQKQEDFDAFVNIIDPKDGQVILDGMDGYGAAAKEILTTAAQKGVKPEIYTLDESAVQVEKAKKNVPDIDEKHIIKADMRETPFSNNFFDTVVIKMGIHEVQKEEQQKIVNEVYRILKENGKFVTWDLSLADRETQVIFQDIIRKKDELAGFDKLVESRYFPRRDELLALFEKAGFQNVSVAHKIDAKLSLRVRESELVSKERSQIMKNRGVVSLEEETQLAELGKKKCDELVAFAKVYMKDVPDEVKKRMNYIETENDIRFEPNKEVIVGYKNK